MSTAIAPIRADSVSAQDRILDAAEAMFAEFGFAGASMKAISTAADVAQGLLHYHFTNKEGLYAAVVARRSSLINTRRHEMLDAVDLAAPDAVDQIFDALLRPPLSGEGGGTVYARIFAMLAVGDSRDQALVTEHYDPTAKRFIAALQQACPGVSAEAVVWAYTFSIGALVATVARNGRPERLAGAGGLEPTDAVVRRIVDHAVGGFRAVIAAEMET